MIADSTGDATPPFPLLAYAYVYPSHTLSLSPSRSLSNSILPPVTGVRNSVIAETATEEVR